MKHNLFERAGGARFMLAAAWAALLIWLPLRTLAAAELEFFFSPTCPHCQHEAAFLDSLERELPELKVHRYTVTSRENLERLETRLRQLDALEYFGPVPITIIDDRVLVGYDESVGQDIRQTAVRLISAAQPAPPPQPLPEVIEEENGTAWEPQPVPHGINPAADEEKPAKPLPLLAVTLGFLDGFNVCSLGALVLILSLVLTMRSRKHMALYGGMFILTTAIIYGALIFLWHGLFKILANYLDAFGLIIGAVGLVGGGLFVREFIRMQKNGVACDAQGLPMVGAVSRFVQRTFETRTGTFSLLTAVLAFAAVITIVEFPCSAAVPVVFAGALTQAHLGWAASSALIALFLLFYLLDELIVFALAVWKLKLWMGSPVFTKWATLAAGLLLITLGAYYACSTVIFS